MAKKEKQKKLFRSTKNKLIAGVCGGIGEYLGIDPTIIRILWIALTLLYGFGILLYLIMWVIVPKQK